MRSLKSIIVCSMMLTAFVGLSQTEKDGKLIESAENARKILKETDKGLDKFFQKSEGYVIFPNVGKGAFIVGGSGGKGVVYENKKAIGTATLVKIDVGFQAGGEQVIEIIFFETDAALAKFKEGNYEFSADISAVALKSGVSQNADYDDGVAIFTYTKGGLMASASVGGQKFSYNSFK